MLMSGGLATRRLDLPLPNREAIMDHTDLALLDRFRRARDADAFAEIVTRYQDFVYSTCLRTLDNPADAQDVAQECFLRLLRKADTVQASLGGWLHRCATDLSIDELRSRAARKNREEASVQMNGHSNPDPTWHELAPHLDQAINELPDELRHVVVEHFLQRRTQADVAKELGVSKMTVSRRVDDAIGLLREKLKKAGVVVSAALLATLITENAVQAAPAALAASLSKLTIIAATESGGAAATAGGGAGIGKLAIIAAVIGAVAVGIGVWKLAGRNASRAKAPAPAAAPVAAAPVPPAAASKAAPKPAEPRIELTVECPADAQIVQCTSNTRRVFERLRALAPEWDFQADPRETFAQQGNPPEAFDGPMLEVWLAHEGQMYFGPPIVRVVPVENMDEMIAKIGTPPDADGIYTRPPTRKSGAHDVPEKNLMLPWKGFAVFSDNKADLKAFAEAPQQRLKIELTGDHYFCVVNAALVVKMNANLIDAALAPLAPETRQLIKGLSGEIDKITIDVKFDEGLRVNGEVYVKPGGILSQYLVPSPGLQALEPKLPVVNNMIGALWLRGDAVGRISNDLVGLLATIAKATDPEDGQTVGSFLATLVSAQQDAGAKAVALAFTPPVGGLEVVELDKPEAFGASLSNRVEAFNKAKEASGDKLRLVYRPSTEDIAKQPNSAQVGFFAVAPADMAVYHSIHDGKLIASSDMVVAASAGKALTGDEPSIEWKMIPQGFNAVIIVDLVPLARTLLGDRFGKLALPKDAKGWIGLKAKEGNILTVEAFASREVLEMQSRMSDPNVPCMRRLWKIGVACNQYAETHDKHYPRSLQELVDGKLLPADLLRCPLTDVPYSCIFDLADGPLIVPDADKDGFCLVWDSQPHDGQHFIVHAGADVVSMQQPWFGNWLKEKLPELLKKQ